MMSQLHSTLHLLHAVALPLLDNVSWNSPKMRALAIGLTALLCTTALVGAADGDVRGSAHSGRRSEANAVVWLEAPNAPPTAQSGRVVLDQRNLMFSPHVLAVRVGTVVDFPNNDRVFHNVFS